MSRSLTRLVPMFVSASLTLTACGGGEKEKERVVGKNAPEMCQYQHDEGGRAIMSNAGRVNRIDSGMFGKQYNRYDLEAILSASGAETVRYANAIDIFLRRIPYNGAKDRCLYEESIPVAPDNFIEYWKRASGGRLNNGEAGVDGLYSVYRDENGKVGQFILVRSSSDRWTLVHELMHANFHSSRMALGQPEDYDSQMKQSSSMLQIYLRDYKSNPTESNLNQVADSYKTLAENLRGTLINYALEEVADESVLIEEYAAGRLKYVPSYSAVNAAWYIKCSREKSLARLNQVATLIRTDVLQPSIENGWSSPRATAQTALDQIAALDQRAEQLAERARVVSGASPEELRCNPLNKVIQARLAKENPHLVYMLDGNSSIRTFDAAIRDLRYTRQQLAQ